MNVKVQTTIFLMLTCTSAFAQQLTVIELNNRTANELIPTIRPLLEPGDYLTGKDYELFLKAKPSTVQTVRDLVARLDRRAAQLLISVTTEEALQRERSGYSVSGSVGGNIARLETGRRMFGDGLSLRAEESTTRGTRTGTPQVRATEGQPALVQQGLSVPIQVTDRQRINNRVIERERIEYHPVVGGFYVTARLNGENVRLDIEQRDDSLQHRGAINTGGISTSATGRLGEWITLGSIGTSESRSGSGIAARQSAGAIGSYSVLIKVEKAASGPQR